MILWENKQIHTKTHSDGLFGEIRRDNNCLVCVDSSLKALYQILGDKYTLISRGNHLVYLHVSNPTL